MSQSGPGTPTLILAPSRLAPTAAAAEAIWVNTVDNLGLRADADVSLSADGSATVRGKLDKSVSDPETKYVLMLVATQHPAYRNVPVVDAGRLTHSAVEVIPAPNAIQRRGIGQPWVADMGRRHE
jgi:hypothetical protein